MDEITKLTYKDLVGWHKKIFQPSNLLVISHGDMHPSKMINNFRKISEPWKWLDIKTVAFSNR